ncbi:hypothetical protein NY2A_b012L [Paramecium bursaria Chlorella virus NY2A]|uniref:Uncharacterized protein b012L n=1 Tax=Paramecium bursaria Chlorella virus NY2A TaxID=46021 RepID=A7IVN7_PBCVN|nr:hypothetical protein NY2A_b012L [Paramecium bursaria Chlorella virus NY2A]ABT14411.1 hypothetical protein NY2A_b012L [Paramecium bursaria Chlorella virus NY2A]
MNFLNGSIIEIYVGPHVGESELDIEFVYIVTVFSDRTYEFVEFLPIFFRRILCVFLFQTGYTRPCPTSVRRFTKMIIYFFACFPGYNFSFIQ